MLFCLDICAYVFDFIVRLLYLLQLTFYFDAACPTDAAASKPLMYVTHNTAPQFRYLPRLQLFNLFGSFASTLRQKSLILLLAINHVFEKLAQVVAICFDAFRMQHTWGDRGTVGAEVAAVSPGHVSRVSSMNKNTDFQFLDFCSHRTNPAAPLRCSGIHSPQHHSSNPIQTPTATTPQSPCTTNTVLVFIAVSTKLDSKHVQRVILPTLARCIHRGFNPRGFVPESSVAQSREEHLDARAVALLG
jgi:hypothetical protein